MAILVLLFTAACGLGNGRLDTEPRATGLTPSEVVRRKCLTDQWPGPWTMCPQAQWVRRVVIKAGYRVVDETGSALVAAGRGRSFYIQATEITLRGKTDKSLDRMRKIEGYSLLARIDGVALYGDGVRETWVANGFAFWVSEGPRGDSIAPKPAELASLIHASKTVAPPVRP